MSRQAWKDQPADLDRHYCGEVKTRHAAAIQQRPSSKTQSCPQATRGKENLQNVVILDQRIEIHRASPYSANFDWPLPLADNLEFWRCIGRPEHWQPPNLIIRWFPCQALSTLMSNCNLHGPRDLSIPKQLQLCQRTSEHDVMVDLSSTVMHM